MTETEKPKPTPIAISAGPRGLQLTTLDDMWRFAKAVSSSGIAPAGLTKPEACLIALQLGAELGLSPMASIQNIAVINGRPTIWGDAMLAVCRASRLFDEEAFSETLIGDEGSDDWAGVCVVRRLGNSKTITHKFSVRDAKRAGLWDKRGPWQQYPQRMLQMRARSWALRDAFPDVLKGIYSAEEARDIIVEAVPSEDHLAQAREAREADAEALPDPSKEDDAVAVYARRIQKADLPHELDGLIPHIQNDSDLSKVARDDLYELIAGRRLAIREPVPDPDPEPTEPVPDPEPSPYPTSESEEAACNQAIDSATRIKQLDDLGGWVESHGILAAEAKGRLYRKIAGRKLT